MEKKRILKDIPFDTDVFMTSFEKASKLLMEHKKELEEQGWSSIHLEMEHYYDGADLIVKGMRLETDAEFNQRRKKKELSDIRKKKAEERKNEQDHVQYLKLKKKFE